MSEGTIRGERVKPKAKPPAMQLYVRDAITDTGHLPSDAFKAYWMLTWKAWLGVEKMEPGYLPGDESRLQEMSGLERAAWRRFGERALHLFGESEDGRYFSKRAVEELARLAEISGKRSETGKEGAAARWQRPSAENGNCHPPAMANGKQVDSSASASAFATAEEEEKDAHPSGSRSHDRAPAGVSPRVMADMQDASFVAFWSAYPRKASKGDAEKAWKQTAKVRPPLADILTALTRLKASAQWLADGGQFVPYPASWLRAKGWEDEPQSRSLGNGKAPRVLDGMDESRRSGLALVGEEWNPEGES